MNVVWIQGPVTANQVVEALSDQVDWKPKTIQTLLRRLVIKGALSFDKQGREHLFRAVVDAQKVRHAASHSFLQRLVDGELAPFLACFLEQEKLTEAEIKELKQSLEARKA
jgi:BlaI family penicillinase repressor